MSDTEIIQENSYLTLHYRITLNSGEGKGQVFIDTFVDRPATIQLGAEQWISAMEKHLYGHKVGDEFSFELNEAFGQHNAELVKSVSKSELESGSTEDNPLFEPGEMIQFNADDGASYAGIIQEVGEDYVILDFNHPFAGKNLKVDVKILGVL
ncbi:FKBP-type peptidyl-prolyl cis-trans isomerase [Basilea psittacipulmonis]|uniref:peptidylprolyl isomerase n=1 Tax=Basilea psittacipulmonis DSM 24701 TaxID=1072685 RepID=A0A077DFC4_9BURK|nr:FKBP-type peptidyl-prolyl cis-trans isomerase [Basilea psittacipulmonis]AIL32831.1 hypothetical protein IX83_05435 [Basilea psittacipulmonis DSM 24701]